MVDPINEVFICFGLEEFFDGHPAGSDPASFDIVDHMLTPTQHDRDAD